MKLRGQMVPNMIRFLLPSLLVIASLSATAGDVYRWVDEDGNVHYSETPPPDQQAEQTGVRTRPTGPEVSAETVEEAVPETPDSDEAIADDEVEQAEAAEEPEQDPEVLEEIRRQNCERAEEGLEQLEEYNRVRVEEEGELRYLTPEEMDEQRERLEQVAEENC